MHTAHPPAPSGCAAPSALERARAFASRSAWLIVPLAAAPAAQAAPVFNTADAVLTVRDCTEVTLPATGQFDPLPSGGVKFHGSMQWRWSGSGGGGIDCGFDLSGTGSGALGAGFLGGHFDFNVALTNFQGDPPLITQWQIDYFINDLLVGGAGQSGLMETTLAPEGLLGLGGWGLDEVLSTWKVSLRVGVLDTAAGLLSLQVPDNSISFNPQTPGTVPEPATGLLAGLALVALAARPRRASSR